MTRPAKAGHYVLKPDTTYIYTSSVTRVERSYVRVLIIWIGVLAALFAFQQYFS